MEGESTSPRKETAMKALVLGVVFCAVFGAVAGIHTHDPRFAAETAEATLIRDHCDCIVMVGAILIGAVAVLRTCGGFAYLLSIPVYCTVAFFSARFMHRPVNEVPPALIELGMNILTSLSRHV